MRLSFRLFLELVFNQPVILFQEEKLINKKAPPLPPAGQLLIVSFLTLQGFVFLYSIFMLLPSWEVIILKLHLRIVHQFYL